MQSHYKQTKQVITPIAASRFNSASPIKIKTLSISSPFQHLIPGTTCVQHLKKNCTENVKVKE